MDILMSLSNKRKRILKQKPSHVIDASVLFGLWDESDKENKSVCEKYLKAMGHKYRGFTTIPLIGETFLAINKIGDKGYRSLAHEFLDSLLDKSLLGVVPIKTDRDSFVNNLRDIDYSIEDDDATHLSAAAVSRHDIFVTIEKNLVRDDKRVTRMRIRSVLGLDVFSPAEIVKKLDI